MSVAGFSTDYYDAILQLHEEACEDMEVLKELLGTEVQIERVKEGSEYKAVFGSLYTSELIEDDDLEIINHVLIFPAEQLVREFNKSKDTIEILDNSKVIKQGDVVKFKYGEETYSYKVEKVESYSKKFKIIDQITLIPLIETSS